jgi:lysophospholipid acyltransferase (LPLAT)-like uncharacterized protein
MLMLYEKRNSGAFVLVSQSKDGEFVAQALHRLGFNTARGSSSRGGGARRFIKLMDVVRDGQCVAFTPDGPRGPLRSIQPGVLAWRLKWEFPLCLSRGRAPKTKELNSWDRFLVPLPFGRYQVVFGDPICSSVKMGPAKRKIDYARL